MLTVGNLIVVLLFCAVILFILSFLLAPRRGLWGAAAFCAIVAILLQVFGVGR